MRQLAVEDTLVTIEFRAKHVNERKKKLELTAEQKSRLLSLGLGDKQSYEESETEQEKAALLHDMLAGTLPVDTTVVDSLPDVLKSLCQNLRSVAGEPMGNLLQEPQTDISVIKRIKDYAKQLGTSTDSKTEHDVTIVIYLAAIAHALLFHNEKITQYSYGELKCSFTLLCEQKWIFGELGQFFEKACQYCDDRCQDRDMTGQ